MFDFGYIFVINKPDGHRLIKRTYKKLSLKRYKFGAGNEVRTRDLNLGKVALYQLSYSRIRSVLNGARGET